LLETLTDVEAEASRLGVTLRCAQRWIIRVHHLVSHVSVSTASALQVREGAEVSRGRGSTLGYRGNLGVGAKAASRFQVEAVRVSIAGFRVTCCSLRTLLDSRYS